MQATLLTVHSSRHSTDGQMNPLNKVTMVYEVADQMEISYNYVSQINHSNVGFIKLCANWVFEELATLETNKGGVLTDPIKLTSTRPYTLIYSRL